MLKPYFITVLLTVAIVACSSKKSKGETPGKPVPEAAKPKGPVDPPFLKSNQKWVDSVFNSLSEEERIAQLFMVAAYSRPDKQNQSEIDNLIKNYKIGGLIFFQGDPEAQVKLQNHYQEISKTPLLIGIDGEWGLAMRLKNTTQFPYQMQLGAIQDNDLIYEMGKEIGRQCKRVGVHVNFAPVVDVNNNPSNPVINYRSFGEDRENVAGKGIAYMKGMQDAGTIANAKHFPGHGDTDVDSHKGLPLISHDRNRLDSIEIYPFKKMIKEGLGSMMVAHLNIPALDSTENLATTLSPKVVDGLLKEELGFKGLIFTDALNMGGVSKYYQPGEVEFKALLAGNDILLFAEDVPTAIEKIKQGVKDSLITMEEINRRVKKVLHAKAWADLDKTTQIELKNLDKDLNSDQAIGINHKLAKAAMTVVKDNDSMLPLLPLKYDTLKIASLVIGDHAGNSFQKMLDRYDVVKWYSLSSTASTYEIESMMRILNDYDVVLVGVHSTSQNSYKRFGVSSSAVSIVEQLGEMKNTKSVVTLFGNPYGLSYFKNPEKIAAWIAAYDDTKYTNEAAAQLIFGGIPAQGKLPVTASTYFKGGTGITWEKGKVMSFATPEELNINTEKLKEINRIALGGIADGAYPGCQIVIAKDGQIFYQKTFGWHTYEKKRKVKDSDMYDLASITKVAATTGCLMKLASEGKFELDSTLGYYLPDLVKGTPYENMVAREMLAHQARLVSWIPFYAKTLRDGKPASHLYSKDSSAAFSVPVTSNLYISKKYEDTIYQRILNTRLRSSSGYRYSDLGYYFFKRIIEDISGKPMNVYAQEVIYEPLGLERTTFNPAYTHDISDIPPTEEDDYFRYEKVQGWVHDMGAAMLGGVGGHAGLFSTATELAKIFQMYLNGGSYADQTIIAKDVIDEFSKCQFCPDNRRGAGFDKPVRSLDGGPTCDLVSLESFGHSGFTGTLGWVDPSNGINYIFLSNRTYPDMENRKLISSGIRTQIQRVIYEAVNNIKNESDGSNVP